MPAKAKMFAICASKSGGYGSLCYEMPATVLASPNNVFSGSNPQEELIHLGA
jgi:hypothetical protein